MAKRKTVKDEPHTGRPSKFTEEVATTILARVMAGESLRSVCRDEAMPARSTVHLWLAANPSFSDQYVRACDVRADEVFDEMFDIADDARNDWMCRNHGEDDPGWVVNGEHVQRSRLRIDARKWALARMNPKKYGEKTTLAGDAESPVQVAVIERRIVDPRN